MTFRLVIPTIGLDNRGGTRIYIELANRLSRRGHQVTILVPRGSITTTFQIDPGVRIKSIGFRIPQIEDISSIIRTMMLFPLLENCDIILANYYLTSFPIAFSSQFKGNRSSINLIQSYEPLVFGEAERTFSRLKKWLAETTYRFPMHQVAVSRWIADKVQKISKRQIRVIHPNIDLTMFTTNCCRADRANQTILAFPGLDKCKGWDDFCQAVKITLTHQPELRVLASSRFPCRLPDGPYNAIHPLNDSELVQCYQSAAVYVHAAWWEGWGLAPLEAMACGTPVVAAASGGLLEFARDEENCLLVPPRSPAALADAIQRVLRDEPLRRRITAGGLETVKRFAWPRMADEMEQFMYEKLSPSSTSTPG